MQKDDSEQEDIGITSAMGQMDRMIPKLCTNIQVSLLNEKHIVLSMLYADNTRSAELIERVTIDIEHAKGLISILNQVIDGVKS